MKTDRTWALPLTGVAFVVVVIAAFMVGGDVPDPTEDSAREIVDFYADNEGRQGASIGLEILAGTLVIFFGSYLRGVLEAAEGERGSGLLPRITFAATVIIAVGLALDATLAIALSETSDDISPEAVQALSALWNNDFMLWALAGQLFLLATGLAVVRHGALPKWLGWIAIPLGLAASTPIGFVAVIGSVLFILISSVLVTLRARKAA